MISQCKSYLLLFISAVGRRPVISMQSFDHAGGISLLCESSGWNPAPRIEWLDRDGTYLPAEATEIQKHVNLFNVKCNITVYDDGKFNRFYCRLQQRHHMIEAEVIIESKSTFLLNV